MPRCSTRNALPICQGHETGGHAAAHVLADVFAQVAIQRFRITVEDSAVMCCIERRQLERCAAHSVRKSLLRRVKARSNAGAGFGGDSSACAKHS